MDRTPGIILPFLNSSQKDLEDEIRRRSSEAGYTSFDPQEFMHFLFTNDTTDQLILEHFGTKGMHWGIRKSQEEKQAIRNTKAKKYEDKAKELQIQIDKNRTRRFNPRRYNKIRKLEIEKKVALEDAERKRQGKLSKKQKQIAIGATVAGVLIGGFITYQSLNSGNARRLMSNGKAFVQKKHGLRWKLNPSLRDPNLSIDELAEKVVKPINPHYGAPGTKMNCRRATLAYEMRRRGYDVAATRSSTGRGQDITGTYNLLHPGINMVPSGASGAAVRAAGESRKMQKPFTDFIKTGNLLGEHHIKGWRIGSRVLEDLSQQPDGARGELGIKWLVGGGHSLAWERVKGETVIFDTQTGQKYVGDHIFKIMPNVAEAGITRLDNKPLNDEFLKRWLRNV